MITSGWCVSVCGAAAYPPAATVTAPEGLSVIMLMAETVALKARIFSSRTLDYDDWHIISMKNECQSSFDPFGLLSYLAFINNTYQQPPLINSDKAGSAPARSMTTSDGDADKQSGVAVG